MGPKTASSKHSSVPSSASGSAATPKPTLTKQQLREQKAAAAEAERATLFGSWTGATPEELLIAQCSKMLWNRPDYSFKKISGEFTCVVILTTTDSKGATQTVRFSDSSKKCVIEGEVKQFACTFALHRVASHLNLKSSLPPLHAEYWAKLDKIRKTSSPSVQKYEYCDDPFSAADRRLRDERETSRLENEEKLRRARENDKSLRPWEQFQPVIVSASQRRDIENLIRDDFGSTGTNSDNFVQMDIAEKGAIVDALVKKGFLKLHAEEAMRYNYDVVGAIDWLVLYVPEDDLPHNFISRTAKGVSDSILQSGASTMSALTRDWAVQNMTKAGYNLETCYRAFDTEGNELDALAHLFKQLSLTADEADTPTSRVYSSAEDLQTARTEEIEALESIYGADAISKDSEHDMICIKINSLHNPDINVFLNIGYSEKSAYPTEMPAVMIKCEKIPAYVRLSLLRELAKEARMWVGLPMVFEAVNWVETHLDSMMKNPGISLVQLKQSIFGNYQINTTRITKPKGREKRQHQKNRSKQFQNAEELAATSRKLQKNYEYQIKTPGYLRMLASRSKLPSFQFRDKIVETTMANQVVIICGETGCGKSTQTGQFILEHLLATGKGGGVKIMCTQPRRISAMSLAERVAAERDESVGKSVGFSIRGENARSEETLLTFCTTGILLRMLQADPSLEEISHVIVDEVHERSVDGDFLLVILRQLLKKRTDFRLILMSATINADTFSNYFDGCPVLNIPGFTHPVKDVYLDELLRLTNYIPEAFKNRPAATVDEDEIAGNMITKAINWVLKKESGSQPVDYYLVAASIKHICEKVGGGDNGAILVFLQGAMEIQRCINVIQQDVGCAQLKLDLIPLHAQLSPKDQSKVFSRSLPGVRKVVVATNVAETSITIEDVVYVIDAGRVKEMRFENATLCLVETLASQASCKQRRGRAGRVRPGICFKLFSKTLEKNEMSVNAVPEILRVPLEQLCLTLKAMGVSEVEEFLGQAVDPPPTINILNAVTLLKDLNAIDSISGNLTALGKHMATIPADLRISKMLIFGCIFHCISPVLTIAAILSSKSPFVIPFEKRVEAQAIRNSYLWDKSDLLTDVRAYNAWVSASKNGKRAEILFCEENFMSMTALVSISDLRQQYLDTLVAIQFINAREANQAISGNGKYNNYALNSRVIKSVITAGLYPQVAVVQHPELTYVETAHGNMAKAHDTKEIKFFTRDIDVVQNEVFLHPSSSLSTVTLFEDLLVIYHSKVLTSKVYLRDATMVSPWPILMFGGPLTVDHEGRTISVGKNVKYQAFPRIAVLANGLRRHLDQVLEEKIEEPDINVVNDTAVGRVLIDLLLS
ncbi:hypothetical protein HK100_004618 [Physocladia obscura]|uniref:RNA helicase n=1 Tax=Physocladia obscura TaxID=109957 RepID=A0AAD5T6X7_9FUNG|nr:hypothetical protein HK100_004618 [Physocladia obscura]